jgi:hypothetical protein
MIQPCLNTANKEESFTVKHACTEPIGEMFFSFSLERGDDYETNSLRYSTAKVSSEVERLR